MTADNTVAHFVYSYLPISETFIYNDIMNIKKYNVTAVSVRKEKNIFYPFKNLFSIQDLPFPRNLYEFSMFKIFDRSAFLKNVFKKSFILHAHFGHIAAKLVHIKNELSIPMITNFYGADIPLLRSSQKKRKLFEKGELFLALSQDMKKDLISMGCSKEKIIVMDMGIDISRFPYRKRKHSEKIRLVTVARFVEKKGLEYLIKAFSEICKNHDAELMLIGKGPLENRLKTFANDMGLKERVLFIGAVPYKSLPSYYYNSDIFVLPSVTDSSGGKDEFSTAMKEAMASGMPVVSTLHAGIHEVIKDGKNGLLAPEKDHISLANKITQLIENPALSERIAIAGRKTAEKTYDIKKRVRALESIYGEYE